ncbi:hypothetical protein Nepgr_000519 [Nepenthes gracilis]|uniref:DYW domain-containing protein n=1 Tax=Nepenthes gracilis TaxID=150966 RepID=A0AAD3P1V9_NEPGR|nr:hypothetical protein Nepgr_000519 [Nepenthes gracilis]
MVSPVHDVELFRILVDNAEISPATTNRPLDVALLSKGRDYCMSGTFLDKLIKKCNAFPHIKQIQAHLITGGLLQYSSPCTKLLELTAISSFGSLSYASLIFRHIENPSTNDWNAIIRGHAQSPLPKNAIACFLSMSRAVQKPDALTCSFTLKACARGLARSEAHMIHSQRVFDEMPQRDVASWNALIGGLAQGSRPDEAFLLLGRMRDVGLKANDVTVLGALCACSQLGALREGEKLWRYIKDEGLDMNVAVCNAVIDMYAKCGFVDKAYRVFKNMGCRKNAITWNTMIMGFAMHGHGMEAIDLFEEMGRTGFCPDSVSFLAVLCACNHAGLVDEGIQLFDSMAEKGLARNVKHYGIMVDLLGRAGRLEEAYDIINSMSVVPDVVLWQTLLGACKSYGNMDMAEVASRKLVEMGSNSCGDFVLLSNVYASYERWNDVGRVRDAMKIRDVKKVPGFSYTEVDGVMHKFVTGDKNHPSWREIYAKLGEISSRIKAYGYVPGTKFVLHDIGEEDKEYALCYHSEKLAVAFGLLRTNEDSPIRVIKNLRICGDCHVVIKLVSQVYNREIIVRDRARFHRFKEGTCSCRDYCFALKRPASVFVFLIIRGYFRRDWNRFLLDGSIRKPRRYKQLPRRAPSTPSPPSLDAEHDSFGYINESLAAAAMMLLDPHEQKDSSDLFVIKITLLGDRQVGRLVFWLVLSQSR